MAQVDQELAKVGSVVVEDRVLRRIIKRHRRVPGIGLVVPHADCYSLPRSALLGLVEPSELSIETNLLPEDHVVVFTGSRAALEAFEPAAMCHAWRASFHARIHVAFGALLHAGKLTGSAIRERINRIGQIEFDEIRLVLRQDNRLLPPVDDTTTYIEFAAMFLELKLFDPHSLSSTFPTLHDATYVEAIIAKDVDFVSILAASRPDHAPVEPLVTAIEEAAKAAELPSARIVTVPSARRGAASARKRGNRARAAVLAIRSGDIGSGRADLEELAARLGRALSCAAQPGWVDALYAVAEAAAASTVLRFTAGMRLLHDIQTACIVAEREVKVVDVMAWALSLGKRPVIRALPATREVRTARHLHHAADKIAECEVRNAAARSRLANALHDMVERADDNVRTALRPKIEAALEGVELRAQHLPERVAQKKLVDELLDQAVAVGRLSLGNLRDAISHNDLKMHDLRASQLTRGDQLLRADKELSYSLDGVYRRGEAYIRFLQKLSSVFFGTPVGRFLSLYLLLPFLGAYTAIEGAQHIVGPIAVHLLDLEEPEIATWPLIFGFAAFLFFVLHVALFRRGVFHALRGLWFVVRLVVWQVPRLLLRTSIMRKFVAGPVWRWLLRPAIPSAIAYLVLPDGIDIPVAAAIFVVVEAVGNSRYGRQAEEYLTDWSVRSGRFLTHRIVPGLIKWLLDIFSELIELIDRGIYRVDEWLRFHAGQSVISLVIKGALGVVWFIVTYVLRLYINLFVEPVINPIKHFPTVTVAAKLMIPFTQPMLVGIRDALKGVLGKSIAGGFAGFTVLVVPGLAGFLVWELKENWKLYGATRPAQLRPISIGHHGETMGGFLRLGFHSGTIPKQFAKLRAASRNSKERAAARHKEALHHVEEAIWKFAERELVATLDEATAFRANDVAISEVEIGSNRIKIHVACPSEGTACVLTIEQQSGWLLASVSTQGWLANLDKVQRGIFELALAGFYKRAAVDIVREQIEAALQLNQLAVPPYDVCEEGLVTWPGPGYLTEVVYDLRARYPMPVVRNGELEREPAILVGQHALFSREPIAWARWLKTWVALTNNEDPPRLVAGPPLLPPLPITAPPPAPAPEPIPAPAQ